MRRLVLIGCMVIAVGFTVGHDYRQQQRGQSRQQSTEQRARLRGELRVEVCQYSGICGYIGHGTRRARLRAYWQIGTCGSSQRPSRDLRCHG